MRRIERIAITAPTLVAVWVAGSASSAAAQTTHLLVPTFVLPTSSLVAILGVLLVLICPAGLLPGDVAGLIKKLACATALGGLEER
jgi:hypothetical protein